jgi:hypothetical protein
VVLVKGWMGNGKLLVSNSLESLIKNLEFHSGVLMRASVEMHNSLPFITKKPRVSSAHSERYVLITYGGKL